MPTLTLPQIASLLEPYYSAPSERLLTQLSTYLDLLMKWNSRTNLSAIRTPNGIVQRHFGESLFASRHLPASGTLLDLGSGAGFPGLPIALANPALRVTLAESQNKKASFLREVVRTLNLPIEVWAARAETFPATRRFEIVTLRAVDQPQLALATAHSLLAPAGMIVHLTSAPNSAKPIPIPGSQNTFLDIVC